jgi:2,3-dihydroxyethylbenzene 1,2-dioxygenase
LAMTGSVELIRERNGERSELFFMSCNQRQHSLAFSRSGRPKRLSHLSTEVADLSDLGLTRDIARSRNLRFRMEIGQHHNDEAMSFYITTPSDWAWEVAWGVQPPVGQSQYGVADIWGHEHS